MLEDRDRYCLANFLRTIAQRIETKQEKDYERQHAVELYLRSMMGYKTKTREEFALSMLLYTFLLSNTND